VAQDDAFALVTHAAPIVADETPTVPPAPPPPPEAEAPLA
jgi:hypothetical protein